MRLPNFRKLERENTIKNGLLRRLRPDRIKTDVFMVLSLLLLATFPSPIRRNRARTFPLS